MNYKITKISCYIGYFVQAIVINFLPLLFVSLNTDYGISLSRLGALSVITFAVQLCVDLLSVRFLKYLGFRGGAVLAHFMSAFGLVLLGVLPGVMDNTFLAVAISVAHYSVGGGLIEVIISPIIEYLPSKNKAAQMSFLHSFYCWGQLLTVLITTVLFLVFSRSGWRYIAFLWAVVPLINMLLFLKVPIIEPTAEVAERADKKAIKAPFFYILLLLMLSAGASEIAVSQWSSTFAEMGLGLSKSAGDLLGPCMFAFLMGVGRLFYGIYGERIRIEKVMLFSAILCLFAYIILAVPLWSGFKLAALALCGLSVSVMWPGTISITAARFKGSGTAVFALLAAAGDIGCSLGPWIFGVVAEGSGMNAGFVVSAIYPAVIVAVMAFNIKRLRTP